MGKRINDDQYHHIKVTKTKNSIIISVDGQEVMSHNFDQVDSYFNDAYVGLGLWDGAVEFQNFFVTDHATTPKPDSDPTPQPDAPEALAQERELIDPATGVRVILQKGELASIVRVKVSHIETNDAHTPAVLNAKDYDLFNITPIDKNEKVVAITKPATVLLPIDAGKVVDKVVYLPNTDKEESLPFTIVSLTDSNGKKQSYVRFTAEHFSEYGLVYQAENQTNLKSKEKQDNVAISYPLNLEQEVKVSSISRKYAANKTADVSSVQQTEPSVMSSSSKATLPDTGDHKTDLSQLGVLAMIGSFLVEIAGYFKKRKD